MASLFSGDADTFIEDEESYYESDVSSADEEDFYLDEEAGADSDQGMCDSFTGQKRFSRL